MVGTDDDGVAVEELVGAAGCIEERGDRVVAPAQRLVCCVGPVRVRGVVVVGEVVDEQVEPVARDEPAADGRRVGVDRPERAIEERESARRSGRYS